MNLLTILIYLFSSLFVVVSVMMLWAYRRLRHFGLFIMALTYGISAALAFALLEWWPLVAGYGLVWILKFIGLDPDTDILGSTKTDDKGTVNSKQ
jgi:hypothetical protein